MKLPSRRYLLTLAAGLAALPGMPRAQPAWPARPIRLIVPFTAGGGTDVMARILAQNFHDTLGQSIIVENVGGAGGTIGTNQVVTAPPDGYTILCGTPATVEINPLIQPGIRYSPLKDLAPISQVTDSPVVLIANRDFPPNTVKELIALARQKPGTINFGSSGPGSIEDLSGEMFEFLAHVEMTHIPYRGTSQSLADLLAGRLQIVFENLPPVLSHIRHGDVKAIAIGTTQRSSLLPDLPTVAESGVPGFQSSSFLGLLAPARTPPDIIERLHQAVVAALHDPATSARLRALGVELVGSGPQQFAAYIAERLALTEKVVEKAHLKPG